MKLLARIRTLANCPYELWIMNLLKVFTSFGYFATSAIFVIYLSEEHDYDDKGAAVLYGVWGFVYSTCSLFTGPMVDALRIRRSIVLGSVISTIGMTMFALAFNKTVLLLAVFVVMPFGFALGLPVMDIGGKRFSYAPNKTIAFGLLYSSMNIGAALAGVLVDGVRSSFGRHAFEFHGYRASSERIIILIGAIVMCLGGLIGAVTIRDVTIGRNEQIVAFQPPLTPNTSQNEKRPWRMRFNKWRREYVKDILYDRTFWRLMLLSFVMMGSRQMFRHLDATFPKWALRAIGPDAPIGKLYSVNPTLIIFLAPLASIAIGRFDIYNVLVVGSLISALSILILTTHASVTVAVLFLCVFTIGEAIYSPQISTLIMGLAPEGKEGAYTSLANAPTFAPKIFVGLMSGTLLQNFCPKHTSDIDRCRYIWAVIAGVSMLTPLFLVLFKCIIYTADVRTRLSLKMENLKSDDDNGGDVQLLDREDEDNDHDRILASDV